MSEIQIVKKAVTLIFYLLNCLNTTGTMIVDKETLTLDKT